METSSRVYFIKFVRPGENLDGTLRSTNNQRSVTSQADEELLGPNPEGKILDVLHSAQPIVLRQSMNITVAFEYSPGKIILGLDEPGYLLADKNPIMKGSTFNDGSLK